MVAEAYEDRAVEEQERAAMRRARRAQLKTQRANRGKPAITRSPSGTANGSASNGDQQPELVAGAIHRSTNGHKAAAAAGHNGWPPGSGLPIAEVEDLLRRRVRAAADSGDRITGETIGQWLGVSARTGRRRLSAMLDDDPSLAALIEQARMQ
jgi:hypothetical protein